MSAAHTKASTESTKLMPHTRAWASANQATSNPMKPMPHRQDCATRDHCVGPPDRARTPPTIQITEASHQQLNGTLLTQSFKRARPQTNASAAARVKANECLAPLITPHSQLATPIITKVSRAKGQALLANRAGTSNATSTSAVMMRCLSMKFSARG